MFDRKFVDHFIDLSVSHTCQINVHVGLNVFKP